MKKSDSISRKIMIGLGIFKLVDIFGVKIELMHKKQTKMVTRIGGFTTTLYVLGVLVFFLSCLSTMLNRKGDSITMGMQFYSNDEKIVRPKADGLNFFFSI